MAGSSFVKEDLQLRWRSWHGATVEPYKRLDGIRVRKFKQLCYRGIFFLKASKISEKQNILVDFVPIYSQHILPWISYLYWHLVWNFYLGCMGCDKLVLFITFSQVFSANYLLFPPFSSLQPLGAKFLQEIQLSWQGSTLPECIWGSFGINTEQIRFFKEPKEHFWRRAVLYQIIKGKEPL